MDAEMRVTCTMVTVPERLAFIAQSVSCFARQTWPVRDLLVLVDDCDRRPRGEFDEMESLLARLAPGQSRLLRVPEKLTLGALRNLAAAEAEGQLTCQWDDDDLYHPGRLSTQVEAIERGGAVACYFAEVAHLLADDAKLFVCSWRKAPQGGHPGTGLFRKGLSARYPEAGDQARAGEDTVYALELRKEGPIAQVVGVPWSYVYRYNGRNTFSRDHHRELVESMGISRALLLRRESDLRRGFEEVPHLDGRYEVHGSNGLAFTLDAR